MIHCEIITTAKLNNTSIVSPRDFLMRTLKTYSLRKFQVYINVLVFHYCCNKLLQTEWLKTQRFIPSEFSRPEVHGQGVCRVMLPPKALGKSLSCLFQLLGAPKHSLVLGASLHLCLCPHMALSLGCLWASFSVS